MGPSQDKVGACPPLTLRISSLADGDMRTRSHQAGHRVFMYCLPWLQSSLYG